ncbi:MAG: hypothetical protein WHT09_08420 [Thermogutta sp.]
MQTKGGHIDLDALFRGATDYTAPVEEHPTASGVDRLDGGRRLLYALWDAGYSLQLVASEFNPTGYVILPVGAISPSEELIRLYDAFHDQAVALFVETCHFAGIPPEEWASWAAQVAARSRKILAAERAAAEKAANKSPGAAPEPHQQDSHGQPGRITSHRRLVERNGEL